MDELQLIGLPAEYLSGSVGDAFDAATNYWPDLLDAMKEFPVDERGEINRSKLGWLLKKNANRIVGGFEFQQAVADGRVAWRVVAA
jgi:hypothetical protein